MKLVSKNIKEALKGCNSESVSKFNENKKEELKALAKGQFPKALVVCCSDSRVIPERIFDVEEGEIFVVRTAGNVINPGELASIEYGIAHLNIKYILVLGHTHCGAVHAAIHHEKGEFVGSVLDRIETNICGEHDEIKASELNAKMEAEFIKNSFKAYDGEVDYALYDIETGLVKFY